MNVYKKNTTIHLVLSGLLLLSAPVLFAAQIADSEIQARLDAAEAGSSIINEHSDKLSKLSLTDDRQWALIGYCDSPEIFQSADMSLMSFITLNRDNPLRNAEVEAAKVELARLSDLKLRQLWRAAQAGPRSRLWRRLTKTK